MRNESILAISLSTRQQGLAIFTNQTLIDYSLKLYKEKWSTRKCSMILSSLASCIKDYNISILILSMPCIQGQTREFNTLYHLIKRLAYEQKIRFKEIASQDIKILCGQARKKTKRTQMEVLCRIYEELQPLFLKEMSNKHKYYQKLFDAVGVATIYSYKY